MRDGLDVRAADVDRRRSELVVCVARDARYDVLVPTMRGRNYIFFRKDRFVLRPDLLIAVVILTEDEAPAVYLVPSEAWKEPDALLASRDFVGKQSPPEWGINLSRKNLRLLEGYGFDQAIETL